MDTLSDLVLEVLATASLDSTLANCEDLHRLRRQLL